MDWPNDVPGVSLPKRNPGGFNEERLFVHGLGGLSTFMALTGITDSEIAMQAWYEAARDFHNGKSFVSGQTFEEYLHDKAAKKATAFNLGFGENQERARWRGKEAAARARAAAWKRTGKDRGHDR